MSRDVRTFPRIADHQPRLFALQSPLVESDLRFQARFCERARRQLDIGHLDVVRHVLAAEPDGVDGNPLALDFGDGVQIDAAGVVRAVAHQNHRADGQRGRIRQHFLQAVADVRGGCARRSACPGFRSAPDDRPGGKVELEICSLNY